MVSITNKQEEREKRIIQGIKDAQKLIQCEDRMPSATELSNNNYEWLRSLIGTNGGFKRWSKELELPLKDYRKTGATDEEIEQEIRDVMKKGNFNRMMTKKEIREASGNNSLNSRIDRTYGYSGWAKRLGVDMKTREGYSEPKEKQELQIKEGIKEAQKELMIERMPTSLELRSGRFGRLNSLITKNKGFLYWAKELNLERKQGSPTKRMNDSEIVSAIKIILSSLSIDRMPSSSEVHQSEFGGKLHNSIVRTYGYREWAKKLSLKLKESETQLGNDYERIVVDMLRDKGYEVDKMTTNHPFDLLVNKSIKVDTKVANPHMLKGKDRVHTFATNKRFGSCDLYIMVALDEKEEIEKVLIIPSHRLQIVTLCIGRNSKYDVYDYRFDMIDKYTEFFDLIK
ncbi:hypothetical protein CIL05_07455 [Virgibacillus profundi]|uniref:Uncharacterized protein n=1 Tax=Virgibacillus profundi TaxID=2024555 RepID=A0A2A2IF68_9BACI|nr:DEK C-terminal domain-containing protein [Virgibacillus profundi]PAV30297.1 hypothetical protein CIL05_07455 [Virgibacillus profundi]PXY54469.1 hypothetical protein CIT14_07540 [Virgibacillus profundi]